MAPPERITYFAYNEGIDPSRLPLGTLAFDYANARLSRRSYRPSENDEKSFKDCKLVDEDKRSNCNMLWTETSGALFDIGLRKVIETGWNSSKSDSRLIVGKKGSKLEIVDSDKFFEDYLLKQDAVREWFETRLSVARSITAAVNNLVKAPDIWLLTGTYIVEDGTVFSIRKVNSSSDASASVPIPEPTGLTELVGSKVGAKIRLGSGIEAQASTQIEGKKVWAAQWIKVKARYVASSKVKKNAEAVMQTVELQDVWSTGTTRGGVFEDTAIEIGLSKEHGESPEEDNANTFDEEWWSNFDETLAGHLEDLDIED